MKRFVLVTLAACIIISCRDKNIEEPVAVKSPIDSIIVDTGNIIVKSDETITFKYKDNVLSNYEKWFDKTNASYIKSPDIAFQLYSSDEKNRDVTFMSEVGQDDFYILYGYFIEKKDNKDKSYKARLKKLVLLYQKINELHSAIQYGGTYYGHKHSRTYGYAAYALHLSNGNDQSDKEYKKGKEWFLNSLRHYINDEESKNFSETPENKLKREEHLMSIVDDMGAMITNYYYLQKAQEFNIIYTYI